MEEIKDKALKLEGVSDFGLSRRKGKRFYVVYNDVKINFGSNGKAYIDHKDEKKRENWKKRHSQIKNKDGKKAGEGNADSKMFMNKILEELAVLIFLN